MIKENSVEYWTGVWNKRVNEISERKRKEGKHPKEQDEFVLRRLKEYEKDDIEFLAQLEKEQRFDDYWIVGNRLTALVNKIVQIKQELNSNHAWVIDINYEPAHP